MISFIVSSPTITLEIRLFIIRLYPPLLHLHSLKHKRKKGLVKVSFFILLTFPHLQPQHFIGIALTWYLSHFLTSKATQYFHQSYLIKLCCAVRGALRFLPILLRIGAEVLRIAHKVPAKFRPHPYDSLRTMASMLQFKTPTSEPLS